MLLSPLHEKCSAGRSLLWSFPLESELRLNITANHFVTASVEIEGLPLPKQTWASISNAAYDKGEYQIVSIIHSAQHSSQCIWLYLILSIMCLRWLISTSAWATFKRRGPLFQDQIEGHLGSTESEVWQSFGVSFPEHRPCGAEQCNSSCLAKIAKQVPKHQHLRVNPQLAPCCWEVT